MRLRQVVLRRLALRLGGGNREKQRHRDAGTGQQIADSAAKRPLQLSGRIGVDALVAAFERAVIGHADPGAARDPALRQTEPSAQIAETVRIGTHTRDIRRTTSAAHRLDTYGLIPTEVFWRLAPTAVKA